jgi:hypothetical protein
MLKPLPPFVRVTVHLQHGETYEDHHGRIPQALIGSPRVAFNGGFIKTIRAQIGPEAICHHLR